MTMQFLAEQNAQGNAILNNPTLRDAISIHRCASLAKFLSFFGSSDFHEANVLIQ